MIIILIILIVALLNFQNELNIFDNVYKNILRTIKIKV